MDESSLSQMLVNVLSSNKEEREKADSFLNEVWLTNHPQELFTFLCKFAVEQDQVQVTLNNLR